MKIRIILRSSPLVSPFYEDGLEVALAAADMEIDTQVFFTGPFLEYIESVPSDNLVNKKIKQLYLYDIPVFKGDDLQDSDDSNVKVIEY